jgi:hypothetical protein
MNLQNDYRDKAQKLIAMANTLAVSSFPCFKKRFPDLESMINEHGKDDWDFFMTVAGVGVAMQTIGKTPPEQDIHAFAAGIQQNFSKWNAKADEAFQDLRKFTKRNLSIGIDFITTYGLWVLENIKKDTPTPEERSIAPVIGRFLVESFDGWWDRLSSHPLPAEPSSYCHTCSN